MNKVMKYDKQKNQHLKKTMTELTKRIQNFKQNNQYPKGNSKGYFIPKTKAGYSGREAINNFVNLKYHNQINE